MPTYQDACDIRYGNVYGSNRASPGDYPVGGVPLGLGIANDIYCSGLLQSNVGAGGATPAAMTAALRGEQIEVKASNTTTTQAAQ